MDKMKKILIGVVIFSLVFLFPIQVRGDYIIKKKGETLDVKNGVQNGVFGSRFSMNFHFDPARNKCWTSTMGSLMDRAVSYFVATRLSADGSVMRMGPSNQSFTEYWHYGYRFDDPNVFDQNGAHVDKDGRVIFTVNSKLKNHFFRVSDQNSPLIKDLIAPFFYQEITVTNYTDEFQSGALMIVLDYALSYRKVDDTEIIYYEDIGGGKIAIATKDISSTWGIGDGIFEYFRSTGRLPNSWIGSQNWHAGGFAVPFVLAPHESIKKIFILAGYKGNYTMIDKINNVGLKFYYTKYFGNIEEVIKYGFESYNRITKEAEHFSAQIMTGSSFDLITGQAIHSYLANTWLLYDPVKGSIYYYVAEGNCEFLSTVDVAYETALFEVEYIPWALKLQLEEWLEYMLRDAYGPYLQHDMGVGTEVRKSQAYSGEMKVEEIVDYILILFLYWKKTGDTAFVSSKMPLLRDFLVSLQKRDTDGNGIIDKEAGYTTFDFDWGNSALGIGQENVYLAIKELTTFLAVEQFEKAISGNGKVYREYAGKISETLKRIYQQYGRLPVSAKDIYKYGWADYTIVNFEGLLYFIITGTEDPLIDDLLCVVAPSHLFALQNCGLRLTSSHPAIWLSKALNAKIANDYFITRGYYTYEDSIIPEIETKVREMELGWTDYNLGSPILYLYPRGVGPATAIVNLMDDFVELNYKIWLHRPSDAGGRSFHFGLLRSGSLTPNQMTQNFRHSYEYVYEASFKINSIECRGFVDYAFVWWFGYHQDKEGHDLFCNLITSWQRCDVWVFWEFYRAWVVIKAYRELLYREPDVSGFSCYLENMRDRGWTEAQVRQSIMDSPEYRLKHPY